MATHYSSKYDSALSLTAIAKLVRSELKGEFPKLKFSVRKLHSKSLSVTLQSLPPEMEIHTMEGALDSLGYLPHAERVTLYRKRRLDADAEAIRARVEKISDQWNFDGSDLQTDYYHVNYYLTVEWDRELVKASDLRVVQVSVPAIKELHDAKVAAIAVLRDQILANEIPAIAEWKLTFEADLQIAPVKAELERRIKAQVGALYGSTQGVQVWA